MAFFPSSCFSLPLISGELVTISPFFFFACRTYFDGTMTHVAHLLMANRTYLYFIIHANKRREVLIWTATALLLHFAWCNNFFSLSFFLSLQPSFLDFLILIWGERASERENFVCVHYYVHVTIRNWLLSYQNGIRDYVYLGGRLNFKILFFNFSPHFSGQNLTYFIT